MMTRPPVTDTQRSQVELFLLGKTTGQTVVGRSDDAGQEYIRFVHQRLAAVAAEYCQRLGVVKFSLQDNGPIHVVGLFGDDLRIASPSGAPFGGCREVTISSARGGKRPGSSRCRRVPGKSRCHRQGNRAGSIRHFAAPRAVPPPRCGCFAHGSRLPRRSALFPRATRSSRRFQ